ncbi:hypothetical protein BaRGS_00001657 [Batillaria attramentaria]|uniref:Uncharacterized protein n=1 Tax=Batillaria attramentaria TaxID=370345 RepID=A0ABD0M624_9CAEN
MPLEGELYKWSSRLECSLAADEPGTGPSWQYRHIQLISYNGKSRLCCDSPLVHLARTAERVDAKRRLQHVLEKRQLRAADLTSHRERREASKLPLRELDEMTSLGQETQLEVTRAATTVQGTRLLRMQERLEDSYAHAVSPYKTGEVVSDAMVTLETDSTEEHVLDASGAFYRDIEKDTDGSSSLDVPGALQICLAYHGDENLIDEITHVQVQPEIFIDDEQRAYPGYFVQYLVLLEEEEERRPTCIVDARDQSVSVSWDALDSCTDCSVTGTGGNLKTGKIRYGELQRCLDVTRVGDTCYLENKYVRVINNNFTMIEKNDTLDVGYYDCKEIEDEVNGAYSPLLDAFFHGTVVGRMYEDWYGMSPLEHKMVFRVHFGHNYSNAFWNGYECQYGDGYTDWHPLVSVDIIGHEVGHGVTEQNSNLYYYQQWGAINEAFSDMAGETAQAYLGDADWVMGVDIIKNDGPPLRYFENPENDNHSIAHVDNYTDYMDPHLGSGVYNRVFYLLVHEYGLPIKEVFHVFLHANQMYWHHMSTYASGACDVMKAAYDLGQDGTRFRQAFEDVGIEVCDTEEHVLGLRNDEVYYDITVSKDVTPTFRFGFPGEFAESVEVNASSTQGEVLIVISDKTWGSEYEAFEILATGHGSVMYEIPGNSSEHLTIELKTDPKNRLTDVMLVATYKCITDFVVNPEEGLSFYMQYMWEGERLVDFRSRKRAELSGLDDEAEGSCCAHLTSAAERVDAKRHLQHVLESRQLRAADMTPNRESREAPRLPLRELDEMTSVGVESEFEVTKATTSVQGTRLLRMQEKFKGA